MLPSLGIRNYRNLKNLDIKRLARVNLIAGKNNTGKTLLLEAVSLYAAGGDVRWINTLLRARGEYLQTNVSSDKKGSLSDLFRNNIKSYSALFYQKDFTNAVEIGSSSESSRRKLTIIICETKKSEQNESFKHDVVLQIYDGNEETKSSLYKDLSSGIWSWDQIITYGVGDKFKTSASKFQFVSTKGSLIEDDSSLWSKIALKSEEEQVVNALKIIDSDVVRLTFVDTEVEGERKAIVKMNNSEEILPLQSMGDGMNRILTIVLALVNAGDGYLLIDEFENGLHYTVQEDLWKMIFKLAKELNVQVFATTHSDDCIHAFESVMNSEGNELEGQYFRLEKFGDIIKPISYSASELAIASNQHIETR